MEFPTRDDLVSALRELSGSLQQSVEDLSTAHERPGAGVVGPGLDGELGELLRAVRAGADELAAVAGRLERALGGRTDAWVRLRALTSPPRPPSTGARAGGAVAGAGGGPADLWWLPSLVLLAADRTSDEQARDELERWSRIRDRLAYVVVDEIVDGVAELAVHPWPLVDERGRVRFPTTGDSGHVSLPIEVLQGVLDAHRERWRQLGLLADELTARPVDLGDVVAADVRTDDSDVRDVAAGDEPQHLHALLDSRSEAIWSLVGDEPVARATTEGGEVIEIGGFHDGEVLLPILDISWDGRESAKLAYSAAFGGEVTTTFQESLDEATERAQEQYLSELGG
jgi:hypothetical protein